MITNVKVTGLKPTERMRALGVTGLVFYADRCSISTERGTMAAPLAVGHWLATDEISC
jgi:hypothetical protein